MRKLTGCKKSERGNCISMIVYASGCSAVGQKDWAKYSAAGWNI